MDKMGLDGFVWFFGNVEDIDDPLKLGRVRVRAFNMHSSSTALIPTEDLPWAHVIVQPTSASLNQVGISPTGMMVGSTVFGFFVDSVERQRPVVLGTLHGIPQPDPETVDFNKLSHDNHDVAGLARGINTLASAKASKKDSLEPSSAYAAVYPHNKVFQTSRGHVVEFDDTPGKERIHVYHRTGTYTEVNSTGRKVDKVVGDSIEIVLGNNTVHIKGNVNILVDGTYTLESKGNMTLKAPRIDLNP